MQLMAAVRWLTTDAAPVQDMFLQSHGIGAPTQTTAQLLVSCPLQHPGGGVPSAHSGSAPGTAGDAATTDWAGNGSLILSLVSIVIIAMFRGYFHGHQKLCHSLELMDLRSSCISI
jgi:hypothetical protein